jgi:hypothetical protein
MSLAVQHATVISAATQLCCSTDEIPPFILRSLAVVTAIDPSDTRKLGAASARLVCACPVLRMRNLRSVFQQQERFEATPARLVLLLAPCGRAPQRGGAACSRKGGRRRVRERYRESVNAVYHMLRTARLQFVDTFRSRCVLARLKRSWDFTARFNQLFSSDLWLADIAFRGSSDARCLVELLLQSLSEHVGTGRAFPSIKHSLFQHAGTR